MRKLSTPIVAFLAVCCLTTGCGTMESLCCLSDDEGGKRIYGGVHSELDNIHQSQQFPEILQGVIDLTCSAVGDTVALPFTIPYSLWCRTESAKPVADGMPIADPNAPR
jgi:uncharacterized protein YceK